MATTKTDPKLGLAANGTSAKKARFYEGELWKRELEQLLMPMIERYDVVLVDDPNGLVRW